MKNKQNSPWNFKHMKWLILLLMLCAALAACGRQTANDKKNRRPCRSILLKSLPKTHRCFWKE